MPRDCGMWGTGVRTAPMVSGRTIRCASGNNAPVSSRIRICPSPVSPHISVRPSANSRFIILDINRTEIPIYAYQRHLSRYVNKYLSTNKILTKNI